MKNKVVTKVTTDKGTSNNFRLPVGKYIRVESLPGYKTETSIIRNQKGMTEVLSLKVENELVDKGSVEITKWTKKVARY